MKEKQKEKIKEKEPEKKKDTTTFDTLFEVNVNDHVEKKNGLSYLSWAYAWADIKKRYPNATYEIKRFGENNLPYVYDQNTGYMVFTSVTIDDLTHEMWLPVMDSANKAMKSTSYTYNTKYKKGIVVEAATMFDINKTIMRCLVKNLAMFGLGLYIYAGEDLPEAQSEPTVTSSFEIKKNTIKSLIKQYSAKSGQAIKDISLLLAEHIGKNLADITENDAEKLIVKLNSLIGGDK